jgi:hypothetical protein
MATIGGKVTGGMRNGIAGVIVVLGVMVAFGYCRVRDVERATNSSAAERLQPITAAPQADAVQRTVYVPIYSSLPLGLDIRDDAVELAATLSIRNVSPQYPIVIEFVRYYDSSGRRVSDYLSAPAQLAPLASVEYVVKRADKTGGPGANFLVRWSGSSPVDEPLVEAVMLGRSGNAGISFTTTGRTVTNEVPDGR